MVDEGTAAVEVRREEDVVEVRVAVNERERRARALADHLADAAPQQLCPSQDGRERGRVPRLERGERLAQRVGEPVARPEDAAEADVRVHRPLERRLLPVAPPARVEPTERGDGEAQVGGVVAAADARVLRRALHHLEQHQEGRLRARSLDGE
eukprot:1256682-Prymnesium_polylepis.1